MRDIKDYLPFYLGHKMIYTGDGLPYRGTTKEEVLTIQNFDLLALSNNRKLALRQLSDMTEEEAIEFCRFNPHYGDFRNPETYRNGFGDIVVSGGKGIKDKRIPAKCREFTGDEVAYLLSKGFDLFQLIPDASLWIQN